MSATEEDYYKDHEKILEHEEKIDQHMRILMHMKLLIGKMKKNKQQQESSLQDITNDISRMHITPEDDTKMPTTTYLAQDICNMTGAPVMQFNSMTGNYEYCLPDKENDWLFGRRPRGSVRTNYL